jgi:cell division septum initiation protein DivIVA
MNDDRLEFDALLDEIKATEQRLVELRKEYRDRKTAGLRDAIAARNEADKAIQEELKSLGYRNTNYRYTLPSMLWRDIA